MTQIPAHFQIPADPVAYINATIATPQARFTVLSSTLIRLEYNPDGHFEDRPSQAFWYRRQSVPPFQVRRSDGMLEIETEQLLLRYTLDSHFSAESLSIQVKASGVTWRYGDPDQGNLLGTTRTLDNVDGQTALEPGLLSRQGWTVVDDSVQPGVQRTGLVGAAPRFGRRPRSIFLWLWQGLCRLPGRFP